MPDPRRLILDTNLLLRLLILDFSTPLPVFNWIEALGVELWTIPLQQDEVRRNLRAVYETHVGQWKSELASAKKSLNETAGVLRKLAVLGVKCDDARKALNEAKQRTETLTLDPKPYSGLYTLAEAIFARAAFPSLDQYEQMIRRASTRIERWNPPCGEKKGNEHPAKRPLGDCAIWERIRLPRPAAPPGREAA